MAKNTDSAPRPIPSKRIKDRPITRPPARKPRKPPKQKLIKTSADFPESELAIRSMVRRAQLGIPQAEAELTNQFMRMLWQMAIRAAKRERDREDFVSIAFLYFRDCIRTFDFRRGTRFITHCYARIPLQLLRPRADYHELIHVSAEAYGRGVRAPAVATLNDRRPCPKTEGESQENYNWLATDPPDHLADLVKQEELEDLRFAILMLAPQHREIIEKRLAGAMLIDIAADLGTCKERVRQIETFAVGYLRDYIMDGILPPLDGRNSRMGRPIRPKLTIHNLAS